MASKRVPAKKISQAVKSNDISIITFRVSLSGTNPEVWRELKLTSQMMLDDLHVAIQGAFGWTNSHLHLFVLGENECYAGEGLQELDELEVNVDDSKFLRLQILLDRNIKKFTYEYDFGDSWQHDVHVLKIEELKDENFEVPICTKGKMAGPPEDCGGVGGFEDFKDIMANENHPDYGDTLDWYGCEFDPKEFSLKEANDRIKEISECEFCWDEPEDIEE